MTDKLVKRLRLPVIRRKTITLQTFGNTEIDIKDLNLVEISKKTKHIKTEALYIPCRSTLFRSSEL